MTTSSGTERLRRVAERLDAGERVKVTIRTLIGWFGYRRRRIHRWVKGNYSESGQSSSPSGNSPCVRCRRRSVTSGGGVCALNSRLSSERSDGKVRWLMLTFTCGAFWDWLNCFFSFLYGKRKLYRAASAPPTTIPNQCSRTNSISHSGISGIIRQTHHHGPFSKLLRMTQYPVRLWPL